MIVVSSGEFRSRQKFYLDKVDNNETVIVQRGRDKSYVIAPVQAEDKVEYSQAFLDKVAEAEAEYKRGESIVVDDIDEFLDIDNV